MIAIATNLADLCTPVVRRLAVQICRVHRARDGCHRASGDAASGRLVPQPTRIALPHIFEWVGESVP